MLVVIKHENNLQRDSVCLGVMVFGRILKVSLSPREQMLNEPFWPQNQEGLAFVKEQSCPAVNTN